MTATPGPWRAEAPGAVEVGVVAALSIEMGYFLDRLSGVRNYSGPSGTVVEGELDGSLVALTVSGMGRQRAGRAAERLIDGHRPRWVISAGFGGALAPDLKKHDVVLPEEIVDLSGGRFGVDLALSARAGQPRGVRPGRLLTADAIVASVAEKARLREQFAADVVDMETSAVAAACLARGIPFASARVISDEALEELPPELARIVSASGSYQIGAAVGALWKRPSRLKDLLRLRADAMAAADRLADVLCSIIGQLRD